MKKVLEFTEFVDLADQIEITFGTILTAVPVKKSILIGLTVDFGPDGVKSVATNISNIITCEELIGLQLPFITNLVPREQKGIMSEAMILLPKIENAGVFIPNSNWRNSNIPNGAKYF